MSGFIQNYLGFNAVYLVDFAIEEGRLSGVHVYIWTFLRLSDVFVISCA